MEQTTRLDLYKLANGDYANHWETPMNANAQAIDDEFAGLATELVGSTTGAFTGLKGTELSLVDRLNNAMDDSGDIIYNSGDLDKSCHQMDGFETTEINDRLGNVDRREFVNARLRYLQRTVASGEFIKKRDAYDTVIASEITRFATEFGLDLSSQIFNFGVDFNDPTYSGGLEVNSVGWGSLSGELFYHKNTVYFPGIVTGSYHVYLSQEPLAIPADADVTVDARMIRSYGSTYGMGTLGNGTAFINTSVFNVDGIGDVDFGENNNWQPSAFQILRVELLPGIFKEYLIKTIALNSVTIYGEFPQAFAGNHWWIIDYTQPCVSIKAYAHSTANYRSTMTEWYTAGSKKLHFMTAYVDNVGASVDFTELTTNCSYLSNPRYRFIDCSACQPGDFLNYEYEIPFTTESVFKIKKMSVVCIEELTNAGVAKWYSISIDPAVLTVIGASTVLVPSTSVIFERTIDISGGASNTWWDSSNLIDGNIIIRCNHTTGNISWIHDVTKVGTYGGFTRPWWGVLIEYA